MCLFERRVQVSHRQWQSLTGRYSAAELAAKKIVPVSPSTRRCEAVFSAAKSIIPVLRVSLSFCLQFFRVFRMQNALNWSKLLQHCARSQTRAFYQILCVSPRNLF
jgi:hypothetical protein